MESIDNEFLNISFSNLGAEMKSIFHKKTKIELLYDGKSTFWSRSAPILFPIVGKLIENSYQLNSNYYPLSQHGFARDYEFQLFSKTSHEICFVLTSSKKTKLVYPFDFQLFCTYRLNQTKVVVEYQVVNRDYSTLYFSIGAHPGFSIPLFHELSFGDYYLEFPQDLQLERWFLNPKTGLFSGKSENIALRENKLPLSYSLFHEDALVFKNIQSPTIFLKNIQNTYQLKFSVHQAPFLGIWTKNSAPFLCIEPWFGLADFENHDQKFVNKQGILSLEPSHQFSQKYEMEFNL